MDREAVKKAAEIIADGKFIIALTGAGISVESGIPAFRGAQGLWEKYDPMEFAHINSFRRNPEKVWRMLAELYQIVLKAQPNPAHFALARLEELGKLQAVITQNVDALHQKAGSKKVIEFHGTGETLSCLKCGKNYHINEIDLNVLPPRCSCEGILKPDIVFFGEPIPPKALEEAFDLASKAGAVLVIGTSAQVYPAAQIPYSAKQHGAKIIEANLEPTPLTQSITDVFCQGKASEVVPAIVKEVEKLINS
jgi:NAD-dependent deacetylase